MSVDEAKTVEEIGDDVDNFEGAEDLATSPDELNAKLAFYDEENPAYEESDDSDLSTETLEGFQDGVESGSKPSDAWIDEE